MDDGLCAPCRHLGYGRILTPMWQPGGLPHSKAGAPHGCFSIGSKPRAHVATELGGQRKKTRCRAKVCRTKARSVPHPSSHAAFRSTFAPQRGTAAPLEGRRGTPSASARGRRKLITNEIGQPSVRFGNSCEVQATCQGSGAAGKRDHVNCCQQNAHTHPGIGKRSAACLRPFTRYCSPKVGGNDDHGHINRPAYDSTKAAERGRAHPVKSDAPKPQGAHQNATHPVAGRDPGSREELPGVILLQKVYSVSSIGDKSRK